MRKNQSIAVIQMISQAEKRFRRSLLLEKPAKMPPNRLAFIHRSIQKEFKNVPRKSNLTTRISVDKNILSAEQRSIDLLLSVATDH